MEWLELYASGVSNSWYVVVFVLQRHPDGVASVAFKEPEEADACILSFNGRWFGGRQLSAQLWDGTTDYQVYQMQNTNIKNAFDLGFCVPVMADYRLVYVSARLCARLVFNYK